MAKDEHFVSLGLGRGYSYVFGERRKFQFPRFRTMLPLRFL